MASMGLKYLVWAKMATEPADAIPTYEAGKAIGKMVSANLAIEINEGELYADDMLVEQISEFKRAEFTAEVANIALEDQAILYGAQYVDNELRAGKDDTPPLGGIGGYQVIVVDGVRKYRAWFFPKVRAVMPDWDAATRGDSITFGTQPIQMKVFSPAYGPWMYRQEFTTEAAAKAYVDTKLGVAAWHNIEVQVQGAGAGKSATPAGVTAVANGSAFQLAISGTVTALYDNGVESKASISSGKYTLSK
jgi:phi13 family phage major tail protein